MARVKSITTHPYKGPVYDLEVEKTHAYIANGIRVHNCHCLLILNRQELVDMGTDINFWMGQPDAYGNLGDAIQGDE